MALGSRESQLSLPISCLVLDLLAQGFVGQFLLPSFHAPGWALSVLSPLLHGSSF